MSNLNSFKAIREFCKECVISDYEIKQCSIKECSLWAFRNGKAPNSKTAVEYNEGYFVWDREAKTHRSRKGKWIISNKTPKFRAAPEHGFKKREI